MNEPWTPGPWEVTEDPDTSNQQIWAGADADYPVCLDAGRADIPTDKANARLIAAAPEMAELLDDLNMFLCYITEENTDARNNVELLVHQGDKLRALLSRIRGEAEVPA